MENKEYSIVGKVEIGTDEYRDLISSVTKLESENSSVYSRLWNTETERNKFKKSYELEKGKSEKYFSFINSSEELKAKYKLWLIEQQNVESETDNES